MPATSNYSTQSAVNRFVLNQGSAGTTVVAAAVEGMRHKVVGCVLSPKGGGISTVQFTGNAGDLIGPIRIPGGSEAYFKWEGPWAMVETPANSPLNVVSTSDGYAGLVVYITEP